MKPNHSKYFHQLQILNPDKAEDTLVGKGATPIQLISMMSYITCSTQYACDVMHCRQYVSMGVFLSPFLMVVLLFYI